MSDRKRAQDKVNQHYDDYADWRYGFEAGKADERERLLSVVFCIAILLAAAWCFG